RAMEVVHRGHARLTGTVFDANSRRPLPGANVAIVGSALSHTTNDRGTFDISGAPGGTQTVLIRAVGYVPERQTVDLVGDQPSTLDVQMTTLRKMLDTMRITASRLYSRDANGFERRRRAGFGTFFDSTDVERYRPFETTRLVERAMGVRVYGSGMDQRIFMGTFMPCEPAIFVDGVTLPDFTAADLNMMVSPEEIVGVEVYTSAASAPVQYHSMSSLSRSGRGCGSIVIWTKRGR
ncbi:MAG TPA: carboxypeptidase-like regulatory domain-containing protein, partial [Gemmatimonadaceae bacterium]